MDALLLNADVMWLGQVPTRRLSSWLFLSFSDQSHNVCPSVLYFSQVSCVLISRSHHESLLSKHCLVAKPQRVIDKIAQSLGFV